MIATFTRFDLRNFATTQPARVIIPLAFVVVFGATLPVPGMPILAGAIIASVTASYSFQGDERGLLDTLYATSPISRRAVTVGRYLSALAMAAAAIGLGVITTLVLSVVRDQQLSWPLIAIMLLGSYAIVAVALSVQLPWFFAMGFTRGRPMIFIPVAVIAVAGWIAGQTGMLSGRSSSTFGAIDAPPALAVVAVLVLGTALLAASAALATRLYRNREL
ncbi:ABC-2 transporter permease [Microlunatus soli]|uniref:ABC-2 family transporter protein n=1 Tax=Microlunatus soli TaxID=630515 RepID=A0A1H1U387_9ACTN|nr:ABC-2 transporter permease [Microlunatus soli]SDS66948.1 ABC-2 family transporter protein [Microlunatus soli]